MTVAQKLEEQIRLAVPLGARSSTGFEQLKCAHCNDYKVRAGFKFEPGSIFYNCFNCGTKTGFIEGARELNGKFRQVLVDFGLDGPTLDRTVAAGFFDRKTLDENLPLPNKVEVGPPPPLDLPQGSVLVSSNQSEWCDVAREYLAIRGLSDASYPFMVTDWPSLLGRLIIPYYLRGQVVYWQARSMDDETIQPRYKNPYVSRQSVIFNADELYRHTTEPLFVTEGPFDAISVGKLAVAMGGSELNKYKWSELERAHRRRQITFIIDKNNNGFALGMKAIDRGMNVACMPNNVEDANHAIQRFGKLWLASYLSSTAVTGFAGKLHLQVHCNG